jgi:hypothetical protein
VRADGTRFYSIQHEIFSGKLSGVRARSQHKKRSPGIHKIAVALGNSVLSLEITLRMLMAFTYLPGFVTVVFRGMGFPQLWSKKQRSAVSICIFITSV